MIQSLLCHRVTKEVRYKMILKRVMLRAVKKTFPVIDFVRNYKCETAVADLVAGITIGLTLIPQSIAYASLAGLGPQYGLYSSLFGGIIYALFGGVPELNIAPTALLSLLTFSFTNGISYGNVPAALLLCFISGVIEVACGVLHLGFLVDFVSLPVVAAFTTAGALTIATSQVKNLLGLKFKAHDFTGTWVNVFKHIGEVKQWDAILGVCCCIILLSMRKLKDCGAPPLSDDANEKHKSSVPKKLIWFCSVARNAFVVIGSAAAAFLLRDDNFFSLSSKVPGGLPSPMMPFGPVVLNGTEGNHTEVVSTIGMMKELGAGLFVLPFVAILGNVAIAKSFAKGKVINASQEMVAVGICNIAGSFFGSYPVNASFSRAALSNASGVRTPLTGIYTGIMVILALTFLTPYFSYIPQATLAAVIICAVIFMVEVTTVKMIWTTNKRDMVPFCITLLFCLFLGIEIGILVGICFDVVILLQSMARPKVFVEKTENDFGTKYIKVTPSSSILFPSAEYVRERVIRTGESSGNFNIVVIDCQRINRIDFTTAKCIAAFITDFKKQGKTLFFCRTKKSVERMIKSVAGEIVRIIQSENEIIDASGNLPVKSDVLEIYHTTTSL